MKIQDLRIGNYVEYRKDIVGIGIIKALTSYEPQKLIYQCSIDFIDSKEGLGSDMEFIYPITLAEEWLVKFGAINPYKDHRWQIGLIMFMWKDGKLWLYDDEMGVEIGGTKPIEFVHTFQNLIYALTGKELEIKLAH